MAKGCYVGERMKPVTAFVSFPLEDIVEKFDDQVQLAAARRLNSEGIDPLKVSNIFVEEVTYDEESGDLLLEMIVEHSEAVPAESR